jgi:hypothetical protein
MQEQRESVGIDLLIFNLSARWRWVVNAALRHLYPQKRAPVPILEKARWAPGQVSCTTGVQTSKRPARCKSQYRLRYPGPSKNL